MRKMLVAALAIASVMQISPSQAAKTTYEATALPCTFTCHDWLDAAGFTGCGAQLLPAGVGYHSKKFKLNPGGETVLSATPPVDWDFWICTNTGSANGEAEIGHAANVVAEECTSPIGSSLVAVGCFEEVTVTYSGILLAVAGNASLANKGFEVRSYNWSDTGTVTVTLDGDQIAL